jgi:hypothetical protein
MMPTLVRNLLVLPLLSAVLLTAPSIGQTRSVYNFLRNDVGARAAALGGSFFAVADDIDAVFYNPAAVGTLERPGGSIGFFKQILDINSGHIAYGRRFEELGWFGAGILYTNYGTFTETDPSGAELGSFGAGDLAVLVTYGNTIAENLTYGANLKFIYSSIAGYRSTGLAGDLGIFYAIPDKRMALGASLRNAGAQISSYNGVREDLPLDFSVGGSIVPKGLPLLLNLAFHRLTDETTDFFDRFSSFTIGGEFTVSSAVLLRFGYDNARRRDLKVGSSSGLAGFSTGVGIVIDDYRLDAALNSYGKVATLYQISLGARL